MSRQRNWVDTWSRVAGGAVCSYEANARANTLGREAKLGDAQVSVVVRWYSGGEGGQTRGGDWKFVAVEGLPLDGEWRRGGAVDAATREFERAVAK